MPVVDLVSCSALHYKGKQLLLLRLWLRLKSFLSRFAIHLIGSVPTAFVELYFSGNNTVVVRSTEFLYQLHCLVILKQTKKKNKWPKVNISQLVRFVRVCTKVSDFNDCKLHLNCKILQQEYSYHKLLKT